MGELGSDLSNAQPAAGQTLRRHVPSAATRVDHAPRPGEPLADVAGEAETKAPSRSRSTDPALPADIAFLAGAVFERRLLARLTEHADARGIATSELLIHRGVIGREAYERLLASHVGAEYRAEGPDPSKLDIVPVASSDELRAAAAIERGAENRLFISPEASGYLRVAQMAERDPAAFRRSVFTGRLALRQALFERDRHGFADRAVTGLATRLPDYSATRRLTGPQALALVMLASLFAGGLFLDMAGAYLACTLFLSVFYFAIVALRAALIILLDGVSPGVGRFRPSPAAPEDYPVYSVLVALKGEAGQVAALVQALDRLDWPKTRREVFLVCEEDDPDTILAIRELDLPEGFEIAICPPCAPHTKPKALDFALPLCSGEFTVIYDAEDRPHPLQLREAWERLRARPKLACVQAPLLVHNQRQNWLTRMFAIEYRTQFLGTLPILEKLGAPLSLGGTSNHFRTSLLRAAGGWDPFNVTEDADLGIRLARLGHGCGTISSPTWEEAPPVLSVWMKQRTRWLKGWLQTVLVHSRNPLRTARELGPVGAVLFHLTITAIVISMLIHPLFLVQLGWELSALIALADHRVDPVMLGISIFNLVGGYTTFAFLAHGVHLETGRRVSASWLLTLPLYWILISAAGWRALFQLVFDPFRWEKTPHGLAKSARSANI